MIRVEIEGKGKVAEFPDGTDPSIIDKVIKRDFFGQASSSPIKKETPPGLTPEEYFKRSGGSGEAEEPGILGAMVNPVEILTNALTGGGLALKAGKPVVKEMVDWGTMGIPSLYRGVRGGARAFFDALSAKGKEVVTPVEKATPIAVSTVDVMPKIRPDYIVGPYGQVIQVPGGPPPSSSYPIRTALTPKAHPGETGVIGAEQKRIKIEGMPEKRRIVEGAKKGEVGQTPVLEPEVKTQLPKSQMEGGSPIVETKVNPSLTPTQPTPELTKEEITSLKQASRDVFEMGKPLRQKLREAPLKLRMEVQSPYEIFAKEPTGNGWKFWKFSEKQDRDKSLFIRTAADEFGKKVKIKSNSPSATKVGEWLDQYENWNDIPDVVRQAATKEEKGAFKYLREKWSGLGDVLVQKGYMEPTRKIRAYLFRMFDKDEIYRAWKDELPILEAEALLRPNDGKLQQQLHKLKSAIDGYDKTGTILYDYIPKNISAPFLKKRLGGEGYSLDAVDAYRAYLNYFARKVYDEPIAKLYYELAPQMPNIYKSFAHDYTRRFLGLGKESRFADVARSLTMLEYLKDLGFNSRSAFVNASQNLNTVIELGPKGPAYMARAVNFARSPEGKQLWNASGHALEVPELRYGFMTKLPERAMEIPFFLFDKVEKGNRKMAYLSGYLKGIDQGMTPEKAIEFADDIVRKTQFLYGRTGSPLMLSTAGGKVLGQFSTFSIKQMELMTNWAKKNPGKLAAYLVTAGAMDEGLSQLGLDMSNALGIGIDRKELYKALRHLGSGEIDAAKIHARMGLPKLPISYPFIGQGESSGGGIFPSGIMPAIETIKKLLKGEYNKTWPVSGDRLYTAIRALREGEVETKEGERGLPVRPTGESKLSHVESLPTLLQRTFLARPTQEKEAGKKVLFKRLLEETQREKMGEAAKLYVDGKFEEYMKIADKYGEPSKQMIEEERDRREETTSERAGKRIGKRRRQFREMIGEGEED